jgi:PKHD-type hydroxylase
MNLQIVHQLLSAEQRTWLLGRLEQSPWSDGRKTAGAAAARLKHNLQVEQGSAAHAELSDSVKRAILANEAFKQLTLPRRVSTLLFSRYDEGMEYGPHTDDAYRSGELLRTDLAVTLFLSPPEGYDGGELVIGDNAFKPAAGDAVVYPASSIHRVGKVTRGTRLAVVFWVQSLVRDEGRRDILQSLDDITARLESPALSLALSRVRQNLLRLWLEP